MAKILTTQNAQITTAAVEVKTLTISGKQVTLAVFRQLRERPLIAADGTLDGVPWGIVNYHPDKCGDSPFEHWHIVWQSGAELLRARVDIDVSTPFGSETADEFMYAVAWEHRQIGGTTFFDGKPPKPSQGLVRWNMGGLPMKSKVSWQVGEVLNYGQRAIGSLQEPSQSAAEWRSELAVEARAEVDRRSRRRDTVLALAELPQLFIAV
ncbi:hypothetical protein OG884_15585 [Streptosporangium sp. NBC_01755]|uniref:hypothetical protein n=1 Tax=Streptosporangium sp. NBC_01755 TaxID=2975949 RepID=UPI002DD7DEEA|nr:hypothetical protein [Streptosporangium sp. NBC_01755]WSD03256.1 hypothetical protein OG884_15585 [Streptosporangium sp. NBC_01755]